MLCYIKFIKIETPLLSFIELNDWQLQYRLCLIFLMYKFIEKRRQNTLTKIGINSDLERLIVVIVTLDFLSSSPAQLQSRSSCWCYGW